jgi:hypothetical protein
LCWFRGQQHCIHIVKTANRSLSPEELKDHQSWQQTYYRNLSHERVLNEAYRFIKKTVSLKNNNNLGREYSTVFFLSQTMEDRKDQEKHFGDV